MTKTSKDAPAYAAELAAIEELPTEEAFPRMVFRHSFNGIIVPVDVKAGGGLTGAGAQVDCLIVGNLPALRNALEHGWQLDASKAQGAWEDEQADSADKRGTKEGEEGDEPPYNPRPNEPDNAPFQNTGYVEHQTGDAEPASPPDPPIVEEIPPEEGLEKPDGQPPLGGSREADEDEEEVEAKRGPGRPKGK